MATVREGDQRYVCVPIAGRLAVIPDACKHRGGPLSLGTLCLKDGTITCPWHDIVNGPKDFERREVPSERVGDELHFEAPATDEDEA